MIHYNHVAESTDHSMVTEGHFNYSKAAALTAGKLLISKYNTVYSPLAFKMRIMPWIKGQQNGIKTQNATHIRFLLKSAHDIQGLLINKQKPDGCTKLFDLLKQDPIYKKKKSAAGKNDRCTNAADHTAEVNGLVLW